MGNRLKMRISLLFRGSCRTGNSSDVIGKPDCIPQNSHHYDYFNLMAPKSTVSFYKPRTLPSFCRPNCPETTSKAGTNSIFPRQKISARYPPSVQADINSTGLACPPAAASSLTMNTFYKKRNRNKNIQKKRNKNNTNNRRDFSLFSSSSQDSAYFEGGYWFSSDEESDELFSSISLSSDSSESHHHHHHNRCSRSRLRKHNPRRMRASAACTKGCSLVGILPLHEKVKDSFAVVKSSSDPYSDFRTSMVEIIIENHIFSAKDLEQLLQSFLSLNSNHHHRIIIEVFLEIWEALFSNPS